MNAQASVIPVYVLTGFLGSGKTTLLRQLVDDAKTRGWKPAILMNEAGEVNLDGMVVDAAVPMAEMLGGCICCTIRADLGLELTQLVLDHDPDVIWIESTGVAEPLEIIDAVTEASMYGRIELRGVVTVVDARHLLDRVRIGSGRTFRLMRDQIRAASLILLNKKDLVGDSELEELTRHLRDWNAGAEIWPTVRSAVDPDRIYGSGERYETVDGARDCGHDEPGHIHDENCGHAHGDDNHSHIQVLTHYLSGPVDSRVFESFVRELPEGVYRAKGIVSFRDTANRYLFQYAYKQSDFLPIRPQKTVHDVLVFIGEGFRKSDLSDSLNRMTAENHP